MYKSDNSCILDPYIYQALCKLLYQLFCFSVPLNALKYIKGSSKIENIYETLNNTINNVFTFYLLILCLNVKNVKLIFIYVCVSVENNLYH